MTAPHRRHDLSDRVWECLRPHLPGEAGKNGGWKNTHRRFCRWWDRDVWAQLLELVIDDPDFEWLMIDASYINVDPHGAGARGGNQAMDRTKGG